MVRDISVYGKKYCEFYISQNSKVKKKINHVLDLVRYEERVPTQFFKKLVNTDGIYEIRVFTSVKSIRILCFYDDGNLIVLTNCFVKQTQKTPRKEIRLAEQFKKEYFHNKKQD